MTGLLQTAQHHDLHEAADMQRRGGCVEPNVAGNDLFLRERIEPGGIGGLVDIAAAIKQAEQGGGICHRAARLARTAAKPKTRLIGGHAAGKERR